VTRRSSPVEAALSLLQGVARADVPLAPLTTYRVGGNAAVFATPTSVDELFAVGSAARDTGLPVLLIGRGSNMLVADTGFPGIAVSLASMHGVAERIDVADTTVVAGGGVALPVLARRTVAAGLTGFEWAVGVPGSVGGAVRMNAGGHGSDMAASMRTVRIADLGELAEYDLGVEALHLGFRSSGLLDHHVVLHATLQLAPGEVAAGEAALTEIVRWRREHQPGGQNCGSVFVNPVPGELAAAQLIDGLGLRGFRIGGAMVSDKHANFIQASDGCPAADVWAVMEHVRSAVHQASGILLRSEVRLVGFPTTADDAGTKRAAS